MAKKRLDELLVERELVENLDKAKRMVMAGLVFSESERLDKAGMKVDATLPLRVKQKDIPYVGRGGLKLEKALQTFELSVHDKIFMDIGSSTGGFTDCALQHGARTCYAIDVGHNQLDWKLRNDDRVVVMERMNFRYVTEEMLYKGKPQVASIDVSFISLKLIFPVLVDLLQGESDIIVLIKPQFEAKREQVETGGIVRDKAVHHEVVEKILSFASVLGFTIHDVTYSPITGGDGNIEFLAHFSWMKQEEGTTINIVDIVNKAHESFQK